MYSAKEMQWHLLGKAICQICSIEDFFQAKKTYSSPYTEKRIKLLHIFVDQENFLKKVDEWKKENGDDFCHGNLPVRMRTIKDMF